MLIKIQKLKADYNLKYDHYIQKLTKHTQDVQISKQHYEHEAKQFSISPVFEFRSSNAKMLGVCFFFF